MLLLLLWRLLMFLVLLLQLLFCQPALPFARGSRGWLSLLGFCCSGLCHAWLLLLLLLLRALLCAAGNAIAGD